MKPKIYIRADGNSQIGLGHVVRCCALADMMRKDFSCTFLIQTLSMFINNEIENAGANFIEIPETQNYLSEAKELTRKYIKSTDIVVLDGYNFDTEYQRIIKSIGCKLVCIDDLHDKDYVADLVINHTPGLSSQEYKAQEYTQFALGLDYALLRPVFLEKAKLGRNINEIGNVLVSFGGADPLDLTYKVSTILEMENAFNKINLVLGSAYSQKKKPKLGNSRIEIHENLSEKQLISVMQQCELAIVPASSVLLELLALKTIIISGYYVDNQFAFYNEINSRKLIFGIGNFQGFNRNKLREALTTIRGSDFNEIINKQSSYIDGYSNVRLLKKFKEINDEI